MNLDRQRIRIPNAGPYGGILWNNLPYSGLYNESIYSGKTFTSFQLPDTTRMELVGSPLPLVNEGTDKSLQLIGFSTDTTDGPVTVDINGRIVSFSPFLKHEVKWRTSSKCTIGFYTPNYLRDVTEDQDRRSVLLINDRGPSIFKGASGRFTTSYMGQLFVITNKKVAVELWIEVRAPESVSFPNLVLFEPLPYNLPNGCTYAYETKVSNVERDVTFVPKKHYLKLTEDMMAFLVQTSVLLDFSPLAPYNALQIKQPPFLVIQNVQTTRVDVESNGSAPSKTYYFSLSLGSVEGEVIRSGVYEAIRGADGSLNTLSFPVPTSWVNSQYVRIAYTFTLSDVYWNEPLPAQVEWVGITASDGGFYKYQNYANKPLPNMELVDRVATGKGEIVILRTTGSFGLILVIPGSITPGSAKLVYTSIKLSME